MKNKTLVSLLLASTAAFGVTNTPPEIASKTWVSNYFTSLPTSESSIVSYTNSNFAVGNNAGTSVSFILSSNDVARINESFTLSFEGYIHHDVANATNSTYVTIGNSQITNYTLRPIFYKRVSGLSNSYSSFKLSFVCQRTSYSGVPQIGIRPQLDSFYLSLLTNNVYPTNVADFDAPVFYWNEAITNTISITNEGFISMIIPRVTITKY